MVNDKGHPQLIKLFSWKVFLNVFLAFFITHGGNPLDKNISISASPHVSTPQATDEQVRDQIEKAKGLGDSVIPEYKQASKEEMESSFEEIKGQLEKEPVAETNTEEVLEEEDFDAFPYIDDF